MGSKKENKKTPTIVSQLDERLNVFEPVPLISDYLKTYQKSFKPLNLQKDTKIFKLHDPESFLNPSSCMLIIRGCVMKENVDGTLGLMPDVEWTTRSKVS